MSRATKRLFRIGVVVGILSFALAPVASAQDVDCVDVSQEQAQTILNGNQSDPNVLDTDNDGIACETTTTTSTSVSASSSSNTFASTGFEAWPIALAGALCLGGALLLRRRREA